MSETRINLRPCFGLHVVIDLQLFGFIIQKLINSDHGN